MKNRTDSLPLRSTHVTVNNTVANVEPYPTEEILSKINTLELVHQTQLNAVYKSLAGDVKIFLPLLYMKKLAKNSISN